MKVGECRENVLVQKIYSGFTKPKNPALENRVGVLENGEPQCDKGSNSYRVVVKWLDTGRKESVNICRLRVKNQSQVEANK